MAGRKKIGVATERFLILFSRNSNLTSSTVRLLISTSGGDRN